VPIDLRELPKEIRDRLELKELTEATFFRALDEDYTDIMMQTISSRSQVDSRHSYIASIYGGQGCYLAGTKITTKDGIKNIEDIRSTDLVWAGNSWRQCSMIVRGRQRYKTIMLRNNQKINITNDHVVQTKRGWVRVGDLAIGDSMVMGNIPWFSKWNNKSKMAAIVAMLMADGHLDILSVDEKNRYIKKDGSTSGRIYRWAKKRIRFYKSDISLRNYFNNALKEIGLTNKVYRYYKDKNTKATKVITIQNEEIFDKIVSIGVPIGKKSNTLCIPQWILSNNSAMTGFLAGYFACDGSFYKNMIEISSCSRELISQMMVWLQSRGIVCRVIEKTRKGKHNTVYRLIIRNRESLRLWVDRVPNLSNIKKAEYKNIKTWRSSSINKQLSIIDIKDGGVGDVFDLSVSGVHEYLADGLVTHNSGKSYAGITICSILDPNFNIEKIFFNYNDVIGNRHKFKPGDAILVDEQSDTYGIDSHRVNIILTALKEQLRKKSIHFVFCSPTLREESSSSMYILETMFIDYETDESYAAYKTRDGHVLGYVRVPNPKTVVSEEFLKAYEDKKDMHLDILTGKQQQDEIEDRANMVCSNELFIRAESIYKERVGYVPMSMLMQIINKIYPEFKSSVIVGEIAARIKLNREISGEWDTTERKKKRQKGTFSV